MIGIFIIVGFLVFAGLMATGRLPALLALPLMATYIALVSGMTALVYLGDVVLVGAMKLSGAMAVVIFGAMFARVIMRTGIADGIIRVAAEFAGDRPRMIALLMVFATAFVFLGVSGLGAVIMVGSIALPIMTGAGIKPVDTAALMLFALGLGLSANTASYGVFIGIFGGEAILPYYLPAFIIELAAILIYIAIYIKSPDGANGGYGKLFASIMQGIVHLPMDICHAIASALHDDDSIVKKRRAVNTAAYLAPLIPIAVVFGASYAIGFGKAADGKIDALAAAIVGFIIASLYASLMTRPRQLVQVMTGAIVDGIKDVAGVLFLFMGIGMVVTAVMHPEVAAVLDPVMRLALPSSRVMLLAFFAVLAPLALYRGPLNMYGMGAGIAVLLMSLGTYEPVLLAGIFRATSYVQEADPTNSQNVWTAGFVGAETSDVLRRMLPFSWGMCAVMLAYVMVFA